MIKRASSPLVLAASMLFAVSLTAQSQYLSGIPSTVPLVQHQAHVVQPLLGDRLAGPGLRLIKNADKDTPDAATFGVKKSGKELKKAVATVKALPWNSRLGTALTKSKQTGKPVLMLQTLGDIGGFA